MKMIDMNVHSLIDIIGQKFKEKSKIEPTDRNDQNLKEYTIKLSNIVNINVQKLRKLIKI